MRIAMIGTGYVGLVSGVCFAEFGTEVVCVDKDQEKIERLKAGQIPIYEPGLQDLTVKNTGLSRLFFTTDVKEALKEADAVFIAVGTPSRRGGGHADLSYVFEAVKEIAACLEKYTVIVTKSTVPVGTGRKIAELITDLRPDLKEGEDFDIASNPEFLREGSAIEDFMRPDRVIIGVNRGAIKAKEVLAQLYRPLYLLETPIVFVGIESSETIKYAANSFLALKISFINEIADFCEKTGADVDDIAKGIGLDKRIGGKFLHTGPGFGGSCFPKDCRALIQTAEEVGSSMTLIKAAVDFNEKRKKQMAERIIQACGGSVKGKRIAVLGTAFKPNTDDMREAPSLVILPLLKEAGAEVVVHDPVALAETHKLIPDLALAETIQEAITGSDALVLLTEWNEYRQLNRRKTGEMMRERRVIDLRNIYQPGLWEREGFTYYSLGRGKRK